MTQRKTNQFVVTLRKEDHDDDDDGDGGGSSRKME